MGIAALEDSLGGTEDEVNTDGGLSSDVVHDTLKNSRRREVLTYLSRAETPVTIGDLTEHVASVETDTPRDRLESQDRKRVYVGLYQSHLPKMDDAGIVEFEKQDGTIDRGVHFDRVRSRMESEEDPVEVRAILLSALVGLAALLTEVALGETVVLSRIVLGASLLAIVVASVALLADVDLSL